ncbi:hypothetical protein Aperf_G00000049418 [Anoplocephala perfoliata]
MAAQVALKRKQAAEDRAMEELRKEETRTDLEQDLIDSAIDLTSTPLPNQKVDPSYFVRKSVDSAYLTAESHLSAISDSATSTPSREVDVSPTRQHLDSPLADLVGTPQAARAHVLSLAIDLRNHLQNGTLSPAKLSELCSQLPHPSLLQIVPNSLPFNPTTSQSQSSFDTHHHHQ